METNMLRRCTTANRTCCANKKFRAHIAGRQHLEKRASRLHTTPLLPDAKRLTTKRGLHTPACEHSFPKRNPPANVHHQWPYQAPWHGGYACCCPSWEHMLLKPASAGPSTSVAFRKCSQSLSLFYPLAPEPCRNLRALTEGLALAGGAMGPTHSAVTLPGIRIAGTVMLQDAGFRFQVHSAAPPLPSHQFHRCVDKQGWCIDLTFDELVLA